ncbi:Recombinase NinB [uncultured Caudovirales phage]|uniref:Recombinase NinB n=1 Tax=uncultured Caudovirales phage TaxID=2100421 RepID=A0A6J5KYM9_9CAUD|nr:Recombinase NinB [uncultured Caudovirales phage]CAB5195155.1 Recombinase NinB [uncultured Caudovirales phage]
MGALSFILAHDVARGRALDAVKAAPAGFSVRVAEPSRSVEQNAALWPLLECFSRQREWPVNGVMLRLSPDEWKDILSASFAQEQVRVSPLIGAGGMVMLGQRTSQMGKRRFSEFLDFVHACAVELGVELA